MRYIVRVLWLSFVILGATGWCLGASLALVHGWQRDPISAPEMVCLCAAVLVGLANALTQLKALA